MSIWGFDVPHVKINMSNNSKFDSNMKRCAKAGTMHLPGGLGRTNSEPVLVGPKGWLTDNRRIHAVKSRQERHRLVDVARGNVSLTQESFFEPQQLTAGQRNDVLPGGGMNQGCKILSPEDATFDFTKHGWYHPKARSKQEYLREADGPDANNRSWGWDIRKSRDHIGYGDGTIGYGDVQESAISSNTPDWFVGVRMCDGPYGVPRFPACDIIDGKLVMNGRQFKRGANLSIVENVGEADEGSRASTPCFNDWKGTYHNHFYKDRRCVHKHLFCDMHPCASHLALDTQSQLMTSGAVVKRNYAPKSMWMAADPKIPGGS
jgi:hypothetical protein